MESTSGASARLYSPQPQWDQFVVMRDYAYTHTQPQWTDVGAGQRSSGRAEPASTSASASQPCSFTSSRAPWSPAVVRPAPLESRRVCTSCHRLKEECICKTCHVCAAGFLKNRHHCRRCWHAVCSACWGNTHYVHMLGRPMNVCDRCSVPWALASIAKRDEMSLLWGLYALRTAAAMPRECITPFCRTFTRRRTCYTCGMPTVTTQPHVSRVVRSDGLAAPMKDAVNVLDMQQLSLRAMEVNGMTTASVERVFRQYFRHHEEVVAFRAVTTAAAAQRILLANVAAAVAYEYVGAPNITLGLSDVPYARVLQVMVASERYTVLEAPGRVKYIAFPGTHNWRTRWVDVRISRVEETVWTPLHEGIRRGSDPTAPPVALCGGLRKTWSYRLHGGFAREAQEVGLPLEELIEDVRSGGYTLVLCGHSLGGAIAQYLTLQLLHTAASLFVPSSSTAEPRLVCVSFGAPVLGNYELADHVESCGWTHLFHNVVNRSDVVPRLSCTDELAWDAQARLTSYLGSVVTAAQSWWRGGGSGAGGAGNTDSSNANVSTVSATGGGEGQRGGNREHPLLRGSTQASTTGTPAPEHLHHHQHPLHSNRSGSSTNSSFGGAAIAAPVTSHRTSVPAVVAKAVRTVAARTLGKTGGMSEAAIRFAADAGFDDAEGVPHATTARAGQSGRNAAATAEEEEEEARFAAYVDTAIRTSHDVLEDEQPLALGHRTGTRFSSASSAAAAAAASSSAAAESAEEVQRDADVGAALTSFSRRRARPVPQTVTGTTEAGPQQQQQKREHEEAMGDASFTEDGAHGASVEPPPPPPPPPPPLSSPHESSSPQMSPDVAADVVIPLRRLHRRFTCFGRYHFLQYGVYGYVSTADSETAFGILKHGCGEAGGIDDHKVAAYNRGLMLHLYRNLD